MTLEEKIKSLKGPLIILASGGFIGANLFRMLIAVRDDVYGTVTDTDEDNWRLQDIPQLYNCPPRRLFTGRFTQGRVHLPISDFKTIFNCIAYGGYSWQTDTDKIYSTNFELTRLIVDDLAKSNTITAYVHAGSSSEYGTNCSGPSENDRCEPNSHYAVSKLAATEYLQYMGCQGFPCSLLRLSSIYGPWEDKNRLIPKVIEHGLKGEYPPFVNPNTTRDFLYVPDACEAFIDAALDIENRTQFGAKQGQIYNIGTGWPTSIQTVAQLSKRTWSIEAEPDYSMPRRNWDTVHEWYSNPNRAKFSIGWEPKTRFEEGFRKTVEWQRNYSIK